jgi:DNA-binding HxlR family transcriptional regulator
MELLEVLGRRWTLRVLWELHEGPVSFRGLRARCEDVSPSVLNERLAELRDLGIVATTADGYALTDDGRSLGELLLPLDAWARRRRRRSR